MSKTPYEQLVELSKKSAVLESIQGLLGWDQETYLPKKAIDLRSEQMEAMAQLIHKARTSNPFRKALSKLINIETGDCLDPTLTPAQKAALREWRRDYLQMAKLPSAFVRQLTETTSKAMHAWGDAKKENNFKAFIPHLEKIVKLLRKKCDFLGYQDHPYDALLDIYEPGMTTATLIPVFFKLKSSLSPFIKSLVAAPPLKDDFLFGNFPKEKQLLFTQELFSAMGFNPEIARVDLSNHPFCCNLHPFDTRMTTHVHTESLLNNLFSVIHEGGHGLYSIGRPVDQFGTPLCESVSLGIEESQSRFWETFIGHSYPFWQHFYPRLQALFPEQLSSISLDQFYRGINAVKSSLIRIESDEVTYSMHIILRFEIEKALIEGSLKVKEIPELWNEKMREYLGVTPPDAATGCLQDIHWSMGAIGYFPTYTLGNLYAAQIFNTFTKRFTDWKERLASGKLDFIRDWLRDQIHRHGREFTPKELILHITGTELDETHYLNYLTTKYQTFYPDIIA